MKISSSDLEDIKSGIDEIQQALNGLFIVRQAELVLDYEVNLNKTIRIKVDLSGGVLYGPELELEQIDASND